VTTAPTPSDAERLARGLEEGFCGHAAWLQPAAAELRRLQDDNERLRSAERTLQRLGYQDRGGQEWAPPIGQAPDFDLIDSLRSRIAELEASKNARIHELEMQALGLACENSILKRQELEALKPLPLSDEQIDAIADGMPGGLGGFMKTWGWRQFARKILDLRAPPTWEPQFDCMAPGQEELAMEFCLEIAGPRGKPGRSPDPVRLLEMAEALYKAEADARGITGGSS
jgi:hypothetical protein